MKKKAQIGIFVLVALIVIVLLVFLLSGNISEKREEVSNQGDIAVANPNTDDLYLIQDSLNYCLERETRRALVIAGFRGGFLFDNDGYYTNSVSISNTYNDAFIQNLGLNWNNLFYQTLVHSQAEVYSPYPPEDIRRNNFDGSTYSQSIKEDFEKFVLDGVITCMELDKFEEKGFKISYEKFSGQISEIDSTGNFIYVQDLQGVEGDNIEVIVDNNIARGTINSFSSNLAKIKINENDFKYFTTNVDLSSLEVINLNSTMRVGVDFLEESVVSTFYFPLRISSNTFETSITTAKSQVHVRFKKLLELSRILLEKKYQNRSLDLENMEDVKKVLQENTYARMDGLDGLEFYITYLNDSDEYRKVVFSFVDNNSIIYGNRFVLNFAYENHAPKIDMSNIAGGIEFSDFFQERKILLVVGVDVPFTMDLKNITSDKQLLDNYLSYFIEQHHHSSDSIFSLSNDGILSFTAFLEKTYNFDIQVTDGELTRTESFVFVSGFPDNQNNMGALNCFTFIPQTGDYSFPVASDFRKTYNYFDEEGKNIVYSYALYNPSNDFKSTQLQFSPSCLGPYPEIVDVKYSINDGPYQILNNPNNIIDIQLGSSKTNVKVNIYDKNGNEMINDPFEYDIFPASCLGPEPVSRSRAASHLTDKLDWTGSCCNTEPIYQSIEENNPSPQINSILGDNIVALDAEFYACVSPERLDDFNPIENVLWDVNQFITSVYDTHIKSTCKGNYPSAYHPENIDFIKNAGGKPVTYSGTTSGATIVSENFESIFQKPFSLSSIQTGSTCEFCDLNEGNMFIKDTQGVAFKLQMKDLATRTPTITTLTSNESRVDIRCDYNIYGGISPVEEWFMTQLSTQNTPTDTVHSSYGFCNVGTTECTGKLGSTGSQSRTDNLRQCINWAFVGQIELQRVQASWVCDEGTYTVCSLQFDEEGNCNIETQTRTATVSCQGSAGNEVCPTLVVPENQQCECPPPPEEEDEE